MLGLFAFFYACLHFSIFFVFDHFFNVAAMLDDVVERKYITAGFLGFVLLMPLAVTSTAGWIRRLGGKRWHRLHQLIYITATAGVVHFLWLVKSDIRRPTQYGVAVGILLLYRLAVWLGGSARAHAARRPRRQIESYRRLLRPPPNVCCKLQSHLHESVSNGRLILLLTYSISIRYVNYGRCSFPQLSDSCDRLRWYPLDTESLERLIGNKRGNRETDKR